MALIGLDQQRTVLHGMLPDSVRYAIRYKDTFGPQEIKALAAAGHSTMALYLLAKGTELQPDRQASYLNTGIQILSDAENGRQKLGEWAYNEADSLLKENDPLETDGKKVGKFSRQDPELWGEKFNELVNRARRNEAATVVIAYTPLIWLHLLLRMQHQTSKPIFLLSATKIQAENDPNCGYKIDTTKNPPLFPLPKEFSRPDTATVFVDDVIKYGRKATVVSNFWHRREGYTPNMLVVQDLREQGSTSQ